MLAARPAWALVFVLASCSSAAAPPGPAASPASSSAPTGLAEGSSDVGSGQTVTLEAVDATSAERVLGPPTSQSSATWAVDGVTYTTRRWPGVELITSPDGAAHSVTCEAPCALRTQLGVGVGSAAGEVERAYGGSINRDDARPDRVVVGEAHGGTFFDLKDGRVLRIFLGAAAE